MTIDYTPLRNALKQMHSQTGHGTWARIGRAAGLSPAGVSIIANKNHPVDNESWNKLYIAYPDEIPAPPWHRSTEETVIIWLEEITYYFYRDLREGLERTNFPAIFNATLAAASSFEQQPDASGFESRLKIEYQKIRREMPPREEWSRAFGKLWKILSEYSPWPRPTPVQTQAFSILIDTLDSFEMDSADLSNMYNYIQGWLIKNNTDPDYNLLERNLWSLCSVFSTDRPHVKESSLDETKIPGLGARLKQAREAVGLTIDTAAEKLDILPGRLDAWENGRSDPPIDAMVNITRLYNADANYLLNGKPARSGLEQAVLSIIKSEPGRHWTAKEITDTINELIEAGKLKIQAI